MMHTLIMALGLVLMIEGLIPFLFPSLWRKAMQHLSQQNDRALRIYGLMSLLLGLLWLYINR